MLIKWFICNKNDHDAWNLYYSKSLSKYVWDLGQKVWSTQTKRRSIGRTAYVYLSTKELYLIRFMLGHVKGALSFDHIKMVEDILYPK